MQGRNLTVAIEHERVHIIPYVLLEIRGTKTIFILLAIFVPLTMLIVGLFSKNTTILFLFIFLELLMLFISAYVLQRETRSKTDHISFFRKTYYQYKNYKEVRIDFKDTYFLCSKHTLFPLIIKNLEKEEK